MIGNGAWARNLFGQLERTVEHCCHASDGPLAPTPGTVLSHSASASHTKPSAPWLNTKSAMATSPATLVAKERL